MRLDVSRQHGAFVELHHQVARVLVVVRSAGSRHDVHADWLLLYHVSHDLQLLLVDVGGDLESHDVLVLVQNGMESATVLCEAFSVVGHVRQQDGLTSLSLNLFKRLLKPFEFVARVLEPDESVPIQIVTDVGVERNDRCQLLAVLL